MVNFFNELPFLPDTPKDSGWFDRDAHIQMYAAMLDTLRAHVGDNNWYRLHSKNSSVHLGPEIKRTISVIVRKCSESCYYESTVDFITEGAVREIEKRASARQVRNISKDILMARSTVAHEHMCPNNVVSEYLTGPDSRSKKTAEILKLLSFRALISGPRTKRSLRDPKDQQSWSDVDKLDDIYLKKIPTSREMEDLIQKDIPLEYYPLLRYHRVGLLCNLIPVSDRARNLLTAYQEFIGLLPYG